MSRGIGWGLENKGVIVTGAAGGIGRAVTHAFAAAGARVCAVDLKQSAAAEVVAETADPELHVAVGFDLTKFSAQEQMLRDAQNILGSVDVLVHLAAVVIRRTSIDDVTEADWDVQNDLNLKATFFLDRRTARMMKEQGRGGRIINFTSQAWWSGGLSGSIVYAATKGGVVSLTRGFARTYAGDNITVNVVAPGGVDTPMARKDQSEESIAQFIALTPVGRLATPQDIVGTVLFLASDHASYITGATINVSGGHLMY